MGDRSCNQKYLTAFLQLPLRLTRALNGMLHDPLRMNPFAMRTT